MSVSAPFFGTPDDYLAIEEFSSSRVKPGTFGTALSKRTQGFEEGRYLCPADTVLAQADCCLHRSYFTQDGPKLGELRLG
jgi:hypothetical protein